MSDQPVELAKVVDRLQRLELRNERLERQNRWMKLGGTALVLCAGLIVWMGADENPTVVKATRFVVLDETGKSRAELDSLGLKLFGEKGDIRIQLQQVKKGGLQGSTLDFIDEKGQSRIKLGYNDRNINNDHASLDFTDEHAQSRIRLGYTNQNINNDVVSASTLDLSTSRNIIMIQSNQLITHLGMQSPKGNIEIRTYQDRDPDIVKKRVFNDHGIPFQIIKD